MKSVLRCMIPLVCWVATSQAMERVAVPHVENKELGRALIRAAERGDARAQYQVGIAYLDGRAGEKSVEKATEWLEKSSTQGLVDAQRTLARLLEKNNSGSLSKDLYKKIISLYEKVAEKGDVIAQYSLARRLSGNGPFL